MDATGTDPLLHRGNLVIMDNYGSHKASVTADAIEAVSAQLRYLPPCNPDYF